MPDSPLGTPVTSSDEPIRRLTALVCDPRTNKIIHPIVNADDVPRSERLVPIDRLADADDHRLTLAMPRHQFFGLKTLETVRPVPAGCGERDGPAPTVPASRPRDDLRAAPADTPIAGGAAVRNQGRRPQGPPPRTPPRVRGRPGLPPHHHLTLQTGHPVSHQDVTIPATDIAAMTEDAIVLRTDADTVVGHAVAQGPGQR
jgi:hypothetical protein